MNKITAFTTGIFISIVSYTIMATIYGKHAESWDHEALYYIAIFFPTVMAFAIAVGTGFVSALLFLAGVLAPNMYVAVFVGNTEQKSMRSLGVLMYMLMLTYPLIAAIAGGVIRIVWLRFFDKPFKRINDLLLDKVDSFIEKPPKWAYRPISFTQSVQNGALVQLLVGLVFGVLGLLLIIYPSPPLNSLPAFVHKLVTVTGYGFLGGFFWYGYRALKLYLDKGGWHISLDNEKLLYHTPASINEPSFECRLDEIDRVEIVHWRSVDEATVSTAFIYIYTTSGEQYDIGNSESRFNPNRLVFALQAQGIKVYRIYEK